MHLTTRYHDFCAGHRVVGHEGKCRHLHGHGYRVHFACCNSGGGLDTIGRVIDFGVIKSRLCQWCEDTWDHRLLLWDQDPWLPMFDNVAAMAPGDAVDLIASIRLVPFNPTAENMASYLLYRIGPEQLEGTGVKLKRVIVEETRKCAVELEV